MADLFSKEKVIFAGFATFFLSILMFCLLFPEDGDPLVDLSAVHAEGFPEITEFAVLDASGVLSRESHEYFNQGSLKLQKANGGEIFVAAVPGISGSLNDVATQLFNGLGLGRGDLNNGALLLFTTDKPHVVLRTGSGLESCINDAKAGRILDEYAVPDIRQSRWNTAARNTWNAVAREIYSCYGGKPPHAVMEKGHFTENAVTSYDSPGKMKVASFGSGKAIALSYSGLAFGGGILLFIYLTLLPGETTVVGGRGGSGFHRRSSHFGGGGSHGSGGSHGGGRSRGGGASR